MYYNGNKVFISNNTNLYLKKDHKCEEDFYNERKAYDQYNKTTVCAGI